MSNTSSKLETAQANYDAKVAAVESTKSQLVLQQQEAQAAIDEQRRLEAAISDGDASSAGQLVLAKGRSRDLIDVLDAFKRSVVVSERQEQQARLDLAALMLQQDPGDMRSGEELREAIETAKAEVDVILWKLADEVASHNEALRQSRNTIKEAQEGLAPNVGVLVQTDAMFVDGRQYTEMTPSFAIDQATSMSAIRWDADRHQEQIDAAKAEVQAKRDEDAARMKADRGMLDGIEATAIRLKANQPRMANAGQ